MNDLRAALEALIARLGETSDGDYLARLANGQSIALEAVNFLRDHGAALLARLTGEDGKLSHAQALAVMGFTGFATVRFDHFHADAERRLGRPIWTHQFPALKDELADAYRADFLAMLPPWGDACTPPAPSGEVK